MEGESLNVIARMIQELCKLPSVGPKSAERMTHHLLSVPKKEIQELIDALEAVKEKIRHCDRCCNLTENALCDLCSDPQRNGSLICVVEQPRDLMAMERAGTFRGLYHVLHGRLAPLENVGPEQLTVDHLMRRVQNEEVQEVIMATTPTLEGDGTALYLSSLLAPLEVSITRLARGISSGSGLEFASTQMLADAFEGRRTF